MVNIAHKANQWQLGGCNADGNLLLRVDLASPFLLRSIDNNQKWGMAMLVSDAWHRRQAVAIASTLPEDVADARIILRLTMDLLEGFLSEGKFVKSGAGVLASRPLPGDA